MSESQDSFGSRILWALFCFFIASIIAYIFMDSFRAGVNGFFWGIWQMIMWVVLFVLFYIVPFVVMSGLFAFTWLSLINISVFATDIGESDYKRLIVVIPATLLASILILGLPRSATWVDPVPAAAPKTAKKKTEPAPPPTPGYFDLDWPFLNTLHQGVASMGGLQIKEAKPSERPYDVGDLSAVMFFAFLIGGPILGWKGAVYNEKEAAKAKDEEEKTALDFQKEQFEEKISALNNQTYALQEKLKTQALQLSAMVEAQKLVEQKDGELSGLTTLKPGQKGVLDSGLI